MSADGFHARRFWSMVTKGESCWIWNGPVKTGYPFFAHTTAHRWSYRKAGNEIPDGFQVDHLCRNPMCVRPDHLEAVTPAENIRRRYAIYTHCKYGHEFTDNNTYRHNGIRHCRACNRRRGAVYRERKKAALVGGDR